MCLVAIPDLNIDVEYLLDTHGNHTKIDLSAKVNQGHQILRHETTNRSCLTHSPTKTSDLHFLGSVYH